MLFLPNRFLFVLLHLISASLSSVIRSPGQSRNLARAVFATDIFSCPAASWPQVSLGAQILPQTPDSTLRAILSEVSVSNIEATILKLVSFGTRHTLSSQTDPIRGIGAARDWIASEFQRYANASDGRLIVEVVGYEQQEDGDRILFPVLISDVVATLHGSEDPDRLYVISGHYDNRVSDPNDYEQDAPGADDDASGVAISLELARIMSANPAYRPRATLVFVAVAGEEQGLYGAEFLAQTYKNNSVNVAGMFTNDIVGSSTADDGTKDPYTIRLFGQGPPTTENSTIARTRLTVGGENDSPARELARFVKTVAENDATEMNVSVIYRLDRYLRGGDHRPFTEAGYTACRFTEPNEDYKHQHQDVRVQDGAQYGDLPEFIDYDFVSRVAKVNGAALWSLAQAPGIPTNVSVNTTDLSNDSEFYWKPPVSGTDLVASYEIVWRTTIAPYWTQYQDVGNVTTARIDLSKDNVIFGIRSVSSDGYKSPAVWPFPIA